MIKKKSTHASTLASKQDSMSETIRKTVKSLGAKVSFTRITPEEKGKLEDIAYTYKRQGVKTSENEINRIAMNFLIEDFHKNGKESVLAQVIDALNA
jgi:phage gp16-like protein